jgi:hypothetical protein
MMTSLVGITADKGSVAVSSRHPSHSEININQSCIRLAILALNFGVATVCGLSSVGIWVTMVWEQGPSSKIVGMTTVAVTTIGLIFGTTMLTVRLMLQSSTPRRACSRRNGCRKPN